MYKLYRHPDGSSTAAMAIPEECPPFDMQEINGQRGDSETPELKGDSGQKIAPQFMFLAIPN